MQIKKVLFTGSLGFLFSNFIRKAAFDKVPYKFSGLDKAQNKSSLNNIYNNKIIETNYLADISDNHIIDNIFHIEKPDIVIHAASYQNSTNIFQLKECIDTNILGTKIVSDACKQHGVSRIIYLSSDHVYQPLPITLDNKLREMDHTSGNSIYSITQAAAENVIISSEVPYNILRICKVYGPRQSPDSFVPSIVKSIMENSTVNVSGNPMESNDWVHVFDFSSALLHVLKNGLENEIYNISSGAECTPLEISQFICNIMKNGYNNIRFENASMQDPKRYCLDNRKILDLGWKPMFKLKKGLEDTVEWFSNNPWALR